MSTPESKRSSAKEATEPEVDLIEIQYALRRVGWTFRRLSMKSGRCPSALRMGLLRGTPWALAAVENVLRPKGSRPRK
ncbi:MAG TPA: hypothetical protein VMV59_01425 [Candidatus Dormibacteraeota bacterium]|nr:hypothetical protein [Candidatus Dormibacteraeota bacterium]